MKFIKKYYYVFIISAFVLTYVEWLSHGSDFGIWLLDHKFVFIGNYLLYMSIYFIILNLIVSIKTSTTIFVTGLGLIGLINFFKLKFKGEYISVYDFQNVANAAKISNNFEIKFNIEIALLIFLIINSLILITFIKPEKMKFNLMRVVHSILLFIVVINGFPKFVFTDYSKNPSKVFSNNGLAYGLYGDFLESSSGMNFTYNEANVKNVYNKYREEISGLDKVMFSGINDFDSQQVKPDIVVVMTEAFSNLADFEELEISENLFDFTDLDQTIKEGRVLVPVYGGSTANSEFEFLTGNTTSIFPTSLIVYDSIINNNNGKSIVTSLKDYGYDAVAIHSYARDFFRRNEVYPSLGFDDYLAYDNFENPEMNELYIKDYEVGKKIIEVNEIHDPEKPLFTFVVTMENHGPFVNDDPTVKALNNLGEHDQTVSNYLSNVKNDVEMYKTLVDYYSKQERPTIVLLFGDHFPSFTRDITSQHNNLDYYFTPYLLYSNYYSLESFPETTSTIFMSSYLFQLAGLDLTFYQEFLLEGSNLFIGYNNNGYVDKNGNYLVKTELNDEQFSFVSDHQLLTYDRLKGLRYLDDIESK